MPFEGSSPYVADARLRPQIRCNPLVEKMLIPCTFSDNGPLGRALCRRIATTRVARSTMAVVTALRWPLRWVPTWTMPTPVAKHGGYDHPLKMLSDDSWRTSRRIGKTGSRPWYPSGLAWAYVPQSLGFLSVPRCPVALCASPLLKR
jgi:hypothetical protein